MKLSDYIEITDDVTYAQPKRTGFCLDCEKETNGVRCKICARKHLTKNQKETYARKMLKQGYKEHLWLGGVICKRCGKEKFPDFVTECIPPVIPTHRFHC